MPFDWVDFLLNTVGWVGAGEVVLAYLLVSTSKVSPNHNIYIYLNLTGSIFLIINTFYLKSYPSMAINIIWAFIALYSIIKRKG
ncbi:MAG: hypothetical protein SFY32_03470 [Bacteroidota bacterium]|nr:hypothetical protein [Bacteroidota bacterium]